MRTKAKNRKLDKIRKEYNSLTRILYENKYILDSNGLSEISTSAVSSEVTWSGKNSFSKSSLDKDLKTTELLEVLIRNGQYSFLFYDYSLLQVEYKVENDLIVKQRIQYIKNNNTIFSFENMEKLRNDWLTEGDQFQFLRLNENIPFLVRVDYDPTNHVDLIHAKSHMTISNIQNCRIPLISNLSLTNFVIFILRNIYGDFTINIPTCSSTHKTITDSEVSSLHFNWNIESK